MIKKGKSPGEIPRSFVRLDFESAPNEMDAPPFVSVNILSFNRCTELRQTLLAVTCELKYPTERLEIIVVDNASEDGSAEMVAEEFPDVVLIRRSVNIGVSAWNDGFKQCHGEYVLVLDDDCYLTGEDLKRVLGAAEQTGAALVSLSVGNPNEPGFFFNRDVNPGLLSFWGCAALMRRDAISKLGGFEPAIFVYTHELEFTMRLLDAGYSHLFLPDVTAMHNKPAGKSKAFSSSAPLHWASNRGVILGKLMPFPQLLILVWRTLLGYLRYGFRTPILTIKVGGALFARTPARGIEAASDPPRYCNHLLQSLHGICTTCDVLGGAKEGCGVGATDQPKDLLSRRQGILVGVAWKSYCCVITRHYTE